MVSGPEGMTPRREVSATPGRAPARATVFLSDCLTPEPVEGAQVVAAELLSRLDGEPVVLTGSGGPVERGWEPVLTPRMLPLRALRAIRRHRPDELVVVLNAGLTYLLLARLLLIHLAAPDAALRVVVLQRPRTPPRWAWRPLRGCLTLVAANEADRQALAGLGLGTELLEVQAAPDRVSDVSRAEARARLGLPPDELVFLHVGHATHGRNLRSLGPLADHGILLLVCSPYSEMDASTLPARPEVRVVHEQVQVADYYRAADVYVFPTVSPAHAIGLPMSIVEAIANGLPVVARVSPLTQRWRDHPLVTLIGSAEDLVARAHDVARRRARA